MEAHILSPSIRRYFDKKTCLITGGSSGIGYALAQQLVASNSSVILLARDNSRLNTAQLSLEKHRVTMSQQITTLAIDIQSGDTLQDRLADFAKSCPVDILINSAGIVHPSYFEDQDIAEVNSTIEINLLGSIKVTKALLPQFCERRRGHIVNISSVAGFIGVFGYAAYSASKFGLWGFSESLRAEMKRYGVSISVVFPPDTDTPMLTEERKKMPSESRAINRSGGLLRPEQVSEKILIAIAKNRFLVFPDVGSGLIFSLRRYMPNTLNRYLDLIARKNGKSRLSA